MSEPDGGEDITLAPVLEEEAAGDGGRVLEEGGAALVDGELVFGGDSNDEFCPSACPNTYIDMKIRSTIVRIEADLV